jgi:hypothetical protein
MSYGFVGGANMLWAPDEAPDLNGWENRGGDKTWPGPEGLWSTTVGYAWPPDLAWDNAPHASRVLAGARLRTISPVSAGLGARVIREYSINARGELEIEQIVEKLRGAPQIFSIWNVTQTQPDAVYLPLSPQSVYKNGFHWFAGKPQDGASVAPVTRRLLRVLPRHLERASAEKSYKIGVDARVSCVVAVKGNVAFVERAPIKHGVYPDGPASSGFPVELYDSADKDALQHYVELEMLSPLRLMKSGDRFSHTVRWSMQKLRSSNPNSQATFNEISRLMNAK